ncbi:MAG: hypothetical protein QN122_11015 [Armatimonadota bacterium]|nr:hypothetical protein [Armatimonadota bacterium]
MPEPTADERLRALPTAPAHRSRWEVLESFAHVRDYLGPVVYGVLPDETLVFIPRDLAVRLATVCSVLQTAATWGELRARLPAEVYQEILWITGATDPERVSFKAFYRRARRRRPRLSRAAARRAYAALDPRQRRPLPEDRFEATTIGSYTDGDWPAWPNQEMLGWVPRPIKERYGEVLDSVFNGPFLQFSVADEAALVEAFTQHGYLCVRDDELVGKASGW